MSTCHGEPMNKQSLADRKILVTGGAGQIGSRLVSSLVTAGASVIIVDRVRPEGNSAYQLDPRVQVYECDLSDAEKLASLAKRSLRDVDHIVHLAARVSNEASSSMQTIHDVEAELLGIVHLLDEVKPLHSICYASSIMVYGSIKGPVVNEDDPTQPDNTYGVLKLAVEKALQVFANESGCPVSILRLSSVYGYSSHGDRAIPKFIQAVMHNTSPIIKGTGSVQRDYLYIDDAIDAILVALEAKACGVFNIGSGLGTTVLDLALAAIKVSGRHNITPQFTQASDSAASESSLVCDISKANRELAFQPRHELEEGLRKLIASEAFTELA